MNDSSATKQGGLNGSFDRREFRAWCARCRRPAVTCYCALIEPLDSVPRFVILRQPRETKHRLGTGRMAHLGLANSLWYEGVDFSRHPQVNQLIADPVNASVLLYPGPGSVIISRLDSHERRRLMDGRRNPLVFVLDGTWKSVRKMLRLSENLRQLPKISFEPPVPSAYGFRREPRPECYSTIEAIHHLIELYNGDDADDAMERRHDRLLKPFRFMVAIQLAHTPV